MTNELKTLRELSLYRPLAEKVLTDLKTSKQLTQDVQEMIAGKAIFNNLAFGRQITPIAMEDLRAEAIKWVKQLSSKLCLDTSQCEHCIEQLGIIDWIKDFFNLTNKDIEEAQQ